MILKKPCQFLTLLFCGFYGVPVAQPGSALTLTPQGERVTFAGELRLKMHHIHTAEFIDVAYKRNGSYLPDGIALLNHFLRDYRTGDDGSYDPKEFDLLHEILSKLRRPNSVIDIICGYRTPATNHFLRTRAARTGVAQESEHMQSKALDLRVPGVSTLKLRDAALSLEAGGVGYYPVSRFVHVDVGPVRAWSFGINYKLHTSHRLSVARGYSERRSAVARSEGE